MSFKTFVLKIVPVIISETIKLKDFDLDNILIDKNSFENILIYDISYKNLIDPKPLRIRLDKINGFIRIYDGTRYLALFGSEKYDAVYVRFRYLISLKSGITHIAAHYLAKIKVDAHCPLPIEKRLNLHNVVILIKSVLKKWKIITTIRSFSKTCSY